MIAFQKMNVLVCGGGNGAHVFSTIAASHTNVNVNVLTIFEDEAERWTKSLSKCKTMTLKKLSGSLTSKPNKVTNDPSTVVPEAEIIFIIAPSYAHEDILTSVCPWCRPNTTIVALPGHPGFEYDYGNIFKDLASNCTMVAFETLPWACRLDEYGTSSTIIGVKEFVGAAIWKGKNCTLQFDVLARIQNLIGDRPRIKDVKDLTVLSLMAKTMIHPPIMYAQWKDWDGVPLVEKPLFYQGVSDVHADMLMGVNEEINAAVKHLQKIRPGIDTLDTNSILDWYREYYADQISDDSCLKRALQTNKAYNGLLHPMREVEDGRFVPDFTYRYTREDIPYGIVVLKGIAEIADVDTPLMDTIILWAQKQLGEEYLVGNKLNGKDLNKTRAPQRFGIHTVHDLFQYSTKY